MIPTSLSLADIQQAFRDIETKINPMLHGNPDFAGRRITNAGKSVLPFDYTTRFELDSVNDAVTKLAGKISAVDVSTALRQVSVIRTGAFALRGSPIAHANELFIASDHAYVGWISDGAAWNYSFGVNAAAQAGISAIAALLGTTDVGYLLDVTDFTHTLKWSGSAWAFKPGDGSGQIEFFPITPNGGTWGLCDGSTYTYLKADGTTGSFVSPNYGTAAYLKAGTSATIGPTASSGTTTSDSGGTPAGTNSAPTFTGTPGTTGNDGDAGVNIATAGATLVALNPHTHGFTPAGTVSAPTFTGSALAGHTHGPSTLELRQTQLTAFFRR